MTIKRLREDIDSFLTRDPAARSRVEVFFCYPGYHGILYYRVANWLWHAKFRFLARFVSNFGKVLTGIEIHPGAEIGRRFFIDHGNGVVIGETSEIGHDVTIYQGVTLGGTSLEKGKRHPTLEDGVIVGSGAQVLGPIRIGDNARIGANAVVLKDVPSGATMVGVPAKMVMSRREKQSEQFTAYGTPTEDLPDPVARGFDSVRVQMASLLERIDALESEIEALKNGGSGDAANEDTKHGDQAAGRAGG